MRAPDPRPCDTFPAAHQAPAPSPRHRPTDEELESIRLRIGAFSQAIDALEATAEPGRRNGLVDVRVFLRAAERIVREGEFFRPSDVAATLEVLDRGEGRMRALEKGRQPWADARGGSARGYVSGVDGSVQPYAVYVPESYDGRTATRLDVILHGRDARLTEVGFLRAHDGRPYPEDESGLILHVFGRGNNAYRWAGEADVFEVIRAASRNYRVDPRRVLLRGFSMGGAGAWHLGLHHPREWCAVEAGAGFTETKAYARLGQLPDCQERALHLYDSVDYALNADLVPIAGYGGEDDTQLRASVNVRETLEGLGFGMKTDGLVTRGEGIDFLHVVGAKTGHAVDPASAEVLRAFRDEHAVSGQPSRRDRVRFVTYSLAYNKAPGLSVEGLKEHYRRAEVAIEPEGDAVRMTRAENVTVLALERDLGESVRFEDQEFPLRPAVGGLLPEVYFRKVEEGWEPLDYDQSRDLQLNRRRVKRPGLQGPIDHAFTAPFLCVRGTGRAWNANVGSWSAARLARFADEWRRYLHGEVRVKDDADVDDEDVASYHLILFGDPGSNRLIARVLPDLALGWARTVVSVAGGPPHAAADHAPALIAASPLNPLRYVVINSGHTFGAEDFEGTNALLYPRLGDFAMLRVRNRGEEVVECGFLDESWRPSPRRAGADAS